VLVTLVVCSNTIMIPFFFCGILGPWIHNFLSIALDHVCAHRTEFVHVKFVRPSRIFAASGNSSTSVESSSCLT
jgi:hypothetical protein